MEMERKEIKTITTQMHFVLQYYSKAKTEHEKTKKHFV